MYMLYRCVFGMKYPVHGMSISGDLCGSEDSIDLIRSSGTGISTVDLGSLVEFSSSFRRVSQVFLLTNCSKLVIIYFAAKSLLTPNPPTLDFNSTFKQETNNWAIIDTSRLSTTDPVHHPSSAPPPIASSHFPSVPPL